MIFGLSISSVVLLALVGVCIYKFIWLPGFFSPLAKIPNAHPTAPYSPIWILWARYRERELTTIHEAHEKHGPIVRLGPTELSVNCVDQGIRTIYAGGFEKHDWYPNIFENYGHPNMFATASGKAHSVRKRMMSNIYAKSYLQASPALEEIMDTVVLQRMPTRLLSATSSKSPVDVFELASGVTMDVVTCYQFGLFAGTNFTQNENLCRHFLELFHGRQSYEFFRQEIPHITDFLENLGMKMVPPFVNASNAEIEAQCLEMCDNASEMFSQGPTPELNKGDHPSVYAQLRSALTEQRKSGTEASPPALTPDQRFAIASEMLDQLAAGFDTSSITLTYLLWELSARPAVQADLRAELLSLDEPPLVTATTTTTPASATVPSRLNPKPIDQLPLLHAIVMETLRRHAAIPGPQPRITPATPCVLAGYAGIPAGVRVSAQAYSLHRNEAVFPDAEAWRPERWLEADEEQLKEMNRWFWAFGSGGRMCVGSNLAMMQIKAILAVVYANFSTSIADDTRVEQELTYTARPKARKLMLHFAQVK